MPVTPNSDQDFTPEDGAPPDMPPHETLSDCVREAPLAALLTAFIAGLFVGRVVL